MQAWNPHLQGDIDKIERVQRRATRIPTGFEKLEYEDRLKRLSFTTLQDSRMRLEYRKISGGISEMRSSLFYNNFDFNICIVVKFFIGFN